MIKDTPTTEPSNRELFNSVKDNNKTSSKDLVSRSISAPPGLPTEEQVGCVTVSYWLCNCVLLVV